jgi:hypothetical protein
MNFEERSTYYLSLANQGSKEWKDLRIGRITSSMISACTGRSYYLQPNEVVKKICSNEEQEMNAFMKHGITMEPIIRNWYSETMARPIKELGIAIWKKDFRFGGSLDGEFDDEEGIEIKAPNKMYVKLIEYIESKKKGYTFYPGYHEHIFNSHYDQMTGNAIITNKKYMHYVVVCTDTQQSFIQRFPVDIDLWENELYPKSCQFYNQYIQPYIDLHKIDRIDP